jgi:hypothetical protein
VRDIAKNKTENVGSTMQAGTINICFQSDLIEIESNSELLGNKIIVA